MRVCIIGAGLAGLSAAVHLAQQNISVSVFESNPSIGGRVRSFFSNKSNIVIDNGKHILAGWYENTIEYLKIIGIYESIFIPDNIDVSFINRDSEYFRFRSMLKGSKIGMLLGFLKYAKFSLRDKITTIKMINDLLSDKNEYLVTLTVKDIFNKYRISQNQYRYFWNHFIYSVFNSGPENVSALVLANVLKKASNIDYGFSLIISDLSLNDMFIKPAVKYLKNSKAEINLSSRVNTINISDLEVNNITLMNNQIMKYDYYISAVPYYSFPKLFDKVQFNRIFGKIPQLKYSSILNMYVIPKDYSFISKFGRYNMIGLVDSPLHWIFINKNFLCVVISNPDASINNYKSKTKDDLKELCIKELNVYFSFINKEVIKDIIIYKEDKATFIPDISSIKERYRNKTMIRNLYVAGDWTDTGLPSTIESAVYSGKKCAKYLLNILN